MTSARHSQGRTPAASVSRWHRVGELLRSAVQPQRAGELARIRRSEADLAGRSPGPMIVGVLAVHRQAGTSTVTALVAQTLAALAPGRVAVFDADGFQQHQRIRLGAGDAGGLRQLLASSQAWRSRRAVDPYMDHAGLVPVLAMAAAERSWPVPLDQMEVAARLVQRRYPTVVVDLPADQYRWAAETADHLIVVATDRTLLQRAARWLIANRPGKDRDSLTIVGISTAPPVPQQADVDLVLPTDPALRRPGPIRLCDLALPSLAAVEEIACRIIHAHCAE